MLRIIEELLICLSIGAILYCCELFIRKKIDEGYFLPANVYGHYAQILTILDDRELRYCRKIKKRARVHLKKALSLLSTSSRKDQYIRDVFNKSNRETKKSWAILFIRYYLENDYEIQSNSTERDSHRRLMASLDEEIKKTIHDSAIMPRSFLDMFPIHWYFEYLEDLENKKRKEEKAKKDQENAHKISLKIEKIFSATTYKNAYLRIQNDLIHFIEERLSKEEAVQHTVYSEAAAYTYYHIFNVGSLMDDFFEFEEWSFDQEKRIHALANVLASRNIITSNEKDTTAKILISINNLKDIAHDAAIEYISSLNSEIEEDLVQLREEIEVRLADEELEITEKI